MKNKDMIKKFENFQSEENENTERDMNEYYISVSRIKEWVIEELQKISAEDDLTLNLEESMPFIDDISKDIMDRVDNFMLELLELRENYQNELPDIFPDY